MNYFSLIDEIKQVSLRYSEEFYEGDIYEYLNSGNHKYPCIILTVQNISTEGDVNTISATIFAVDRLTNDSSNKLEVQSLCMSKITQILGTLEENVNSIQSNTFVPFTEKFSDLCGGMYGEFTLEYLSDSVCDLGLKYEEIELTRNGIYSIIGYDKAIVNVEPIVQDLTVTENGEYLSSDYQVQGFDKVTVNVEPILQDLTVTEDGEYLPSDYGVQGFNKVTATFDTSEITVTEDGEYLPSDYGVQGFSKVTAAFDTSNLPKVRPTEFCIVGTFGLADGCIDSNGRWIGENMIDTSQCRQLASIFYNGVTKLKKLDVSTWDTSKVTAISYFCASNITSLQEVTGLGNWDTSSVTTIQYLFSSMGNSYVVDVDLRDWDTSKVTSIVNLGSGTSKIKLNIENWDTSKVTAMNYLLYTTKSTWANLVGISGASITNMLNPFQRSSLTTIVGDYTISQVINNNLKVFDGIKVGFNMTTTNLTRPSYRAIINGLADLTGGTAQTLTIGSTGKSKLTTDDIAIATSKNWTIA